MPDDAPSLARPDATHLQSTLTVVGIGASAGGLEACTKLVRGLPDGNGMAFILVQHLDPTHDSLLVSLLGDHTAMPVVQAADGMPLERDHLYIIPPGAALAVGHGALHLSKPPARRGQRLPFDFLLDSMARDYAERAVCIILSGTGSDGTIGLAAIKRQGGLVIVQDPADAQYDGMPQSALGTGLADLVLAAADIPDALATHPHPAAAAPPGTGPDDSERLFREIIGVLRTTTRHDFTSYKPGTLQRRIERRLSMAGTADLARYLDLLRRDKEEANRLASDLLINITSFFRDPAVFKRLETEVIPAIIRDHDPAQPLRLWTVGCSTGEETWSIAMLFREQLAEANPAIRLQVFASDVDADAVAAARIARYPETIAADVSPARLARFFVRDEQGLRIVPELRSLVVFSVQDVLADPPFSRMDFISCRNLLIYLQRAVQDRVLSLFDFALLEGGVLLLGAAETIGKSEGRFEAISKPDRLYRRVGRGRPAGVQFPIAVPGRSPMAEPVARPQPPLPALAALGQRLLLDAFAPAAVLVNARHECLYSLGPVDRYLQVPVGSATQNVLTLAREGVRPKLRAALRRTDQPAAPARPAGPAPRFDIEVRPVQGPGDAALMICFVEQKAPRPASDPARPDLDPQVAELERELAATRVELAEALRSSEVSSEEQKALSEEALSVSEEHQSANEELLTSKEELQSLNEELTALNSQLQETLERQRTTTNDMQNVLYSTDVATLFLDRDLNIRFFTPATRSLFKVIPGDVGRPLTDLVSLAADATLPADAAAVLHDLVPREREIEAAGAWFMRRVLPYRTEDSGVEGVVITFTDITERKHAARALEAAKHEAERANAAKSRFLAAASHDLRQPLQTLTVLQALLAKAVTGETAGRLVVRLDKTLAAMSGMLNTVLGIDQIEAGVVRADVVTFPIAGLLTRLRDEYGYQAEAQGLGWCVMPCNLWVRSDPALLEQMLRNLVSNALRYTRQGRILLGCRRHGDVLLIEVRDTGIGIPADKLETIFEEYSQLDNAVPERDKGLGLGLSIVRRLADLVGHAVRVRSRPDAGSVFSIEVPLAPEPRWRPPPSGAPVIFIVDDDAALRQGLRELLQAEGRAVEDHASAEAFLQAYRPGRDACLLVDANLPGLGGLDLLRRLRGAGDRIPAIVITGHGDVHMAVEAMRAGASDFIEKPVSPADLRASLDRALEQSSDSGKLSSWRAGAARAVGALTERQREVMALVIAGHPSKNIAADLGISQRTVESHRAAIMERTGSKSLPALARLALAAAWTGSDESLIAAGIRR